MDVPPGTALNTRLNLPDTDPRKHPSKTRGPILEKVDAAAKKHDINYRDANDKFKRGEIKQEELNKEIEMADDEFIDDLAAIKGINMTKTLASKAILLKKYGEKLGILPRSVFSIQGGYKPIVEAGIFPPNHLLLKEREEIQTGGLLPALIPWIIPIVSSLAGVALDHAISAITKKKQEGGAIQLQKPSKSDDDETKREYIFKSLDRLKPEDQIDVIHKVIKK